MRCSTDVRPRSVSVGDISTDKQTVADSAAAPFLLAATADLKAYRDAKGYRPIPIGYSATDTMVLRPMLQDYLVCRSNVAERLDFFSLNSYEWCGPQSYEGSGYMALQQSFDNYPVPVFFSETGCNTVPPRDFGDQAAIFGSNMTGTWSGAIIYEWIAELNAYGLISYGPFASNALQQGTTVIDG
jgi:1,3-beta-glucanosyltransferase GAS1